MMNGNKEGVSTVMDVQPSAPSLPPGDPAKEAQSPAGDPVVVQMVRTDGTPCEQGTVVDAEDEVEEKPGICKDPCHYFHWLFCLFFPPYIFIWMAVCMVNEKEPEDTPEEAALREQEREDYFEEKRKKKEEKQRKKEEKKQAKLAKKLKK